MSMRPTHLIVSRGAFRRNYEAISKELGKKDSKLLAAIKADAYGMGAVTVARWLSEFGVDFFAVATPDEAQVLRQHKITSPILVLGASPYDAAEYYVEEDIRATLTDYAFAKKLSEAAVKLGKTAKVHMKIDSGMGRVGFLCEEYPTIAEKVAALPGIEIEGVFTHFSTSDESNLDWTHEQFRKFSATVASIKAKGIAVKMVHCCNSSAVLAGLQDYYCDYVRLGQITHGIIPTPECRDVVKIERAFALKTKIGLIRELPEGWPVSYGRTYRAKPHERTAILPIGYGDGFLRTLSNKGDVLIRGERCPILGRICMDQCVVGVGHLAEAAIGDEAVIIGAQGDQEITIEEYAAKAGVITAAVSTNIMPRVERLYVEEL